MTEGAAASSDPATAPDWSSIHRDILCSLCDYNLRGLIEPRCPECGHRTEWAELLDPDRGLHPWLFEHRRQRRVRAFLFTLLMSQVPLRFWNSVKPTHIPRRGRIVLYWFGVAAIVALGLGLLIGFPMGSQYHRIYRERQDWAAQPDFPPLPHWRTPAPGYPWRFNGTPPMYPSLYQAYVEADGVDQLSPWSYSGWLTSLLFIGAGYLLWPWLTIASLQIFRRTMKMVRINTLHVMHCAIYSADAGLILGLVVVPIVRWRTDTIGRWSDPLLFYGRLFEPVILASLAVCVLILTARLYLASRKYLRFPHALATCVAAQSIVALTLLLLYSLLAPI